MLLTGVVMGGISLQAVLYIQTVEGLSPLDAGLWLIPQNLAMVVGSLAAPMVSRWIRPAHVMAGGLAVGAVGFLLLTLPDGAGGLGLVVTGLALAAGGIAFPMALTMNLILSAAPMEKAGSAASLSESGGEFGIAMGIATLGSLGTVIYRTQVADQIPAGVPSEMAQTAGESIAGAVATAPHLPGALGAELLDSAGTAFTAGLNTVAGVGVAVFVGLAVMAALVFRKVQPSSEPQAEQLHEPIAVATAA